MKPPALQCVFAISSIRPRARQKFYFLLISSALLMQAQKVGQKYFIFTAELCTAQSQLRLIEKNLLLS
jgi:hypothetical protein